MTPEEQITLAIWRERALVAEQENRELRDRIAVLEEQVR